jgi:hypothetical protein
MNRDELLAELERIAARWRKRPHESNDYAEGCRYSEIVRELKDLHSTKASIEAKGDSSTNYQVILK